ncbi:unnamed protein product [Fraxinus pennsylvanica]|uniref:Large ribosomal subunit protein bL12 oligomerization domain-containing protein n=1 Tax=Fraxinus pennsylvanica TaxID=56036 RepID=A0AAD1YXC2_9LAMI|nr:unnamed protein product [Fraxinus pennsylvanica]
MILQGSRFISQTLSRLSKRSIISRTHSENPSNFSNCPRNFAASAQEPKAGSSENVLAIVNDIAGLTLVEISDLTEVLRKKMGIEEMPMMAMMMPGMGFGPGMAGQKGKVSGAGPKEEEKKEKTSFDLKLEGGFDAAAKIKIIKEVRACTDLGESGLKSKWSEPFLL